MDQEPGGRKGRSDNTRGHTSPLPDGGREPVGPWDNELEKLALYAGDRAIEEGDIGLLTSQAREPTIFSAVDALLEGRSTAALKMMLTPQG